MIRPAVFITSYFAVDFRWSSSAVCSFAIVSGPVAADWRKMQEIRCCNWWSQYDQAETTTNSAHFVRRLVVSRFCLYVIRYWLIIKCTIYFSHPQAIWRNECEEISLVDLQEPGRYGFHGVASEAIAAIEEFNQIFPDRSDIYLREQTLQSTAFCIRKIPEILYYTWNHWSRWVRFVYFR